MKILLPFLTALFYSNVTQAQQNVGIGTSIPEASAQLDVSSTTKGFLSPRMTAAQRIAITSPVDGLLVYQTSAPTGFYLYKNGVWSRLTETTTSLTNVATPIVTICCQSWMTKNLDVNRYRNGDLIPLVTDNATWGALTTGAYCYYNNDSVTYAAVYGKIYNGFAVNDPRGLAPEGWHVPTDFELTTLANCLGGASVAGGPLKELFTGPWTAPNFGATNLSGFTAVGGGSRSSGGVFGSLTIDGYWWSSSASTGTGGWAHNLNYNTVVMSRGGYLYRNGFSVRCIRD